MSGLKNPILLGTLVVALATACKEPTGDRQVFQVKGVVQELKPAEKTVVIKHEKIPDYMDAMTMPFEVKDVKELDGLQPGDTVSFRMIVTPEEGWIDQIKKLAAAAPVPPKLPDGMRVVREVEALNVGDAVPNYAFTNELEQAVSLHQFQGKAVAITFIFTRCPFPNFCPRMTSHFATVQEKLKTMPNAPTNWHLLTISFDVDVDTPAVLKQYALRQKYDADHWSFLTGALIDIDAIAEQLGLQFWKQEGTINHNLRTAVFDTQGQLQRIFKDNTWEPDELVQEIIKAAGVQRPTATP